ncbi:hypothetical protein J2W32_005074 [Variovorax boronicumulans]|uniref:Radical SAM protein n=1 Tax=Variovorax boronicumulans TaxID=436515 RepID=A0AAW8CZM8_9BURK|nr:hypothetical protein [Variovorax boronicumulans]MDP9895974.1 hypothetical protein [Variovorax boronicumulans]MDQ0056014.1 hypothetical protein [Variovorax boronicumulans]
MHPAPPVEIALADLPRSAGSPLFERLRASVSQVTRRTPLAHEAARWHTHTIGGVARRFAQPITFTPYASVRPCSARCSFCSENLRKTDGGTPASRLRPASDYFDGLARTLRALRGVPLSWSLSGLETSDDADWMLQLLHTLTASEKDGPLIEDRVLYTNGAGFAAPQGEALRCALQAFGLSWLELSRHHHDGATNQAIMRFRPEVTIGDQTVFERTARQLADAVPLRLVCILQRGGVAQPQDVAAYLSWARQCGASTVVFREFSRLDDCYRDNATARYLRAERVSMDALLTACLDDPEVSRGWTLEALTEGYYFWNLRLRTESGLNVVFESADYGAMHARHATGDIYKLVYFADGQLCAGWEPGHDVLLDTRTEQQALAHG